NKENQWRLESPGAPGWDRSADPKAADKYFIVSTDNHLPPPPKLFFERIEPGYRDRLPRIEKRGDRKYFIVEGRRPMALLDDDVQGEDLVRAQAGSGNTTVLVGGGASMEQRTIDQALDGIDAEV